MHVFRFLSVVFLSFVACGCTGDGRKPVYPVQGTVLVQGQPLQQAQVIFFKDGDDKELGTRPHGKTDEQGRFQLTTYVTSDGAPEGKYKVLIVGGHTGKQPPPASSSEGGEEREKSLIAPTTTGREHLAEPGKTTLSADVAKQGNDFRFTIP